MWIILRLSMLVLFRVYLASIRSMLYRLESYRRAWKFGQIIAMTVWIPVVGKYVWLNIGKHATTTGYP
jgi:hypothetical protein